MRVVGDAVGFEGRHGAAVGRGAEVVGAGAAGVDGVDEWVGGVGGEGAEDAFGHCGAACGGG